MAEYTSGKRWIRDEAGNVVRVRTADEPIQFSDIEGVDLGATTDDPPVDGVPKDDGTGIVIGKVGDETNIYVSSGPGDKDWIKLARKKPAAIVIEFDNPIAGAYRDVTMPFEGEILEWQLVAEPSGSIQIDIWKDVFANYPPTDADSITASAPVAISAGTSAEDSTLTGWAKEFEKKDVLRFYVDSVTTITKASLSLVVEKDD